MKKYKIFSLCLSKATYSEAVELVINSSQKRESYFVCFANTHMIIEAYKSKEIQNEISKSNLILPDGWPVAKSMTMFNNYHQDRIAGMDFIGDILLKSNENSLSIFLFGGTEKMIQLAKKKIESEYESINLAGSISPPFNTEWNDEAYITEINNSGTNLVLVALGCPKQEVWMAKNQPKIKATMLGVGAALPVFAGIMPRCPKWLRDNGFEWAYRLYQEPRRLFMRYFTSNFLFVYLFLIEFMKIKLGVKKPEVC